MVGASGGCGSLAVTLARILGAHVTGICSTRNKGAVQALGADEVIAYDEQSFGSWAPQELYDVLYDTVSSPDPRDPNYEPRGRGWLKPGAVYTAINSAQPMDWVKSLVHLLTGVNVQRAGFDLFLPGISQVYNLYAYNMNHSDFMLNILAGT